MTAHTLLSRIIIISLSPLFVRAQSLEKAEVTIPYSELKALLIRNEPTLKPPPLAPALISARLRLSFENKHPVIDATFRTTSFGEDEKLIPLMSGDVAIEKQEPQTAAVIVNNATLNLAIGESGVQTLQLRLLPIMTDGCFNLTLPPCPSTILETGELPSDQAILLYNGKSGVTLNDNETHPLPHTGASLTLRVLDDAETQKARRPAEPSSWTWQHQALIIPTDGELTYHILARASATSGSGVEANLNLPPDAREMVITGEDLVSQIKSRGENRTHTVALLWKTRGILDRQITITYQMPLRPLDRTWHLQAPGGKDVTTRFIIATSELLDYAANGLSDPLLPRGLPAALSDQLNGSTCRLLESSATADLSVTPIPVAATEEGVVTDAQWTLKIEPDGAMLSSGIITIEHKGLLDFLFDTPENMKLLSCELNGKPVSPVDMGEGRLKVQLPRQLEKAKLSCSFTGQTTSLDPVEGTMKLSLPKTPIFIHSLQWVLDLPSSYQAETQGNLTRFVTAPRQPSSLITLQKKLCRNERPEIHVFYQRADLNH